MITTYSYRLKDGNKRELLRGLAGEVNFVWNFSNEFIRSRWKASRKYTSRGDLHTVTRGSSKLLRINAQTIQAVAYECLLRTQKAKKFVRFRTAKGGKNLGWVPFSGQAVKFHGGYIDYNSLRFRLFQHRNLPPSAVIKCGSFSEDARGRWYVNLVIEISDQDFYRNVAPKGSTVGGDLGIKTILTTSDGEKFERDNLTKVYEEKLAAAQRRGKKKLAKKVHAKIKNKRLDFNHKMTEKLAAAKEIIFIGDVSSSKLKKTKMAKGVSDAAWSQIKILLEYKTIRRRGRMLIISEKYSTVTCSTCLKRTGPSGLSGLSIREWTCSGCESLNERDTNAAKNILRLGLETLSGWTERSA